ncbi:MAG: hypothetical protein RDV48_18060 [Candidatus Eremiobacteraeota bacterium]|nr:hypothetical protein [Candidatus Eremiobacteraeota bacterium]
MKENTSFPPATKLTLGVRADDIPFLKEHRSKIAPALANQIIARDAVVFFEEVPLKIKEVLPSSPAIITRLTTLSFAEDDFVPPEGGNYQIMGEAAPVVTPLGTAAQDPSQGPPPVAYAKMVTLGVRPDETKALEEKSDLIMETLDGEKVYVTKTIFVDTIPLLVMEVDPHSPAMITKRTRISLTEHEFLPEGEPPPKNQDTQKTIYMVVFFVLAIAIFFLGSYLFKYATGKTTFTIKCAVKIPPTVAIRREAVDVQAETVQRRLTDSGIDARAQSKPDETIELRVANYGRSMNKLITTTGNISYRAYESDDISSKWVDYVPQVFIEKAEVKKGAQGPEIHYTLAEASRTKFVEAMLPRPNVTVCLFMDDEKISSPVNKEQVRTGNAVLKDKGLTEERAQFLAAIMRNGAYQYPMEILNK